MDKIEKVRWECSRKYSTIMREITLGCGEEKSVLSFAHHLAKSIAEGKISCGEIFEILIDTVCDDCEFILTHWQNVLKSNLTMRNTMNNTGDQSKFILYILQNQWCGGDESSSSSSSSSLQDIIKIKLDEGSLSIHLNNVDSRIHYQNLSTKTYILVAAISKYNTLGDAKERASEFTGALTSRNCESLFFHGTLVLALLCSSLEILVKMSHIIMEGMERRCFNWNWVYDLHHSLSLIMTYVCCASFTHFF